MTKAQEHQWKQLLDENVELKAEVERLKEEIAHGDKFREYVYYNHGKHIEYDYKVWLEDDGN
jgi:hypothetical protein